MLAYGHTTGLSFGRDGLAHAIWKAIEARRDLRAKPRREPDDRTEHGRGRLTMDDKYWYASQGCLPIG